MLDEPRIELRNITGEVRPDGVVLTVTVFNPEDRTLYAYSSPRRIVYDAGTKTLTVSLHDHHVEPDHPIAPHLPQPRFESLEGHAQTDVPIYLPRVLRRVRDASQRTAGEPMTEELNISEATTVTVEMAHQDTPFYFNPRLEKTSQLRQWGEQVAALTSPIQLRHADPDGG